MCPLRKITADYATRRFVKALWGKTITALRRIMLNTCHACAQYAEYKHEKHQNRKDSECKYFFLHLSSPAIKQNTLQVYFTTRAYVCQERERDAKYSKPTRGDRKRNGLSVVPFLFCAICGSSYLTSTSAPAATRSALIFSASSLETPSLIAFGAASTRSFASFRPRPVISRTTLITPSF